MPRLDAHVAQLASLKNLNFTSLLCRSLSISESQHCLSKARVRQLNAFSTGVIWTERAACNGGLHCTLSSVPFDQPDNNAMLAMNHHMICVFPTVWENVTLSHDHLHQRSFIQRLVMRRDSDVRAKFPEFQSPPIQVSASAVWTWYDRKWDFIFVKIPQEWFMKRDNFKFEESVLVQENSDCVPQTSSKYVWCLDEIES